jgi:hypothetical protein
LLEYLDEEAGESGELYEYSLLLRFAGARGLKATLADRRKGGFS